MNTLQKFDRRIARLEQKNYVGIAGEGIVMGGMWASEQDAVFGMRVILLNDMPTVVVDVPKHLMDDLEETGLSI